MIPTIEDIVAGLLAGTITKEQAVAWLYKHKELSAEQSAEAAALLDVREGYVCVPVDRLKALVDEVRHQSGLREDYQDWDIFNELANELLAVAKGEGQ